MFSKAMCSASAAALAAGILGVAALQVPKVAHACDISWSGPNNPNLRADAGTGAFEGTFDRKELETIVVLFFDEWTFTLHLIFTSRTSTNIASCSISPSSFLNAGTGNATIVNPSNLTGALSDPNQDGTLKIRAWNNEHPEL